MKKCVDLLSKPVQEQIVEDVQYQLILIALRISCARLWISSNIFLSFCSKYIITFKQELCKTSKSEMVSSRAAQVESVEMMKFCVMILERFVEDRVKFKKIPKVSEPKLNGSTNFNYWKLIMVGKIIFKL